MMVFRIAIVVSAMVMQSALAASGDPFKPVPDVLPGDDVDSLLKSMDISPTAVDPDEKHFPDFDPNREIPKLTTLDNDPMHLKDPLDDPNSAAVEDMLGMTKQEREELAKEPRIDTPVDIAIKACLADSYRLGCGDDVAPLHCIAKHIETSAADISMECRQKAEKSLQYACSVELFITHCDGVEMPLIPCLEKNHPSLGDECKDALMVTKKVQKSLKEVHEEKAAEAQADAAKGVFASDRVEKAKSDYVRERKADDDEDGASVDDDSTSDDDEESNDGGYFGPFSFLLVAGIAFVWYNNGAALGSVLNKKLLTTDLSSFMSQLSRGFVAKEASSIRVPGVRHTDWGAAVESSTSGRDEGTKLSNFSSYGGIN